MTSHENKVFVDENNEDFNIRLLYTISLELAFWMENRSIDSMEGYYYVMRKTELVVIYLKA